jgi:hypothetical protein
MDSLLISRTIFLKIDSHVFLFYGGEAYCSIGAARHRVMKVELLPFWPIYPWLQRRFKRDERQRRTGGSAGFWKWIG